MTGCAWRLCTVAALLLALAPTAAASAKQPHFYKLGVGDGPAMTDGNRDVAFLSHKPSIAFYDFGVAVPGVRAFDPPVCEHASDDPPFAAPFDAVGAGEVVWNCFPASSGPLIENRDTGTLVPSNPPSSTGWAEGSFADGIGRRWMSVVFLANHAATTNYYNLSTGAWRSEPTAAREFPNLDAQDLGSEMCGPLRRTREPPSLQPAASAFHPYFYERPYGVGVRGVNAERITLQRCGSHRVRVIGRCRDGCASVGFSAGVVTWTYKSVLHAYVPRTRRHYAWPLRGFGPGLSHPDRLFGNPTLVHTRQRLIASIPPRTATDTWKIWAARMPKR